MARATRPRSTDGPDSETHGDWVWRSINGPRPSGDRDGGRKSLVFVIIFDHSTILTDLTSPIIDGKFHHIIYMHIFHVNNSILNPGARSREAIETVVKTDFAHLEQPLADS